MTNIYSVIINGSAKCLVYCSWKNKNAKLSMLAKLWCFQRLKRTLGELKSQQPIYWTIRDYAGPFRDCVGPYGTIRYRMGPCRTLWDRTIPCETLDIVQSSNDAPRLVWMQKVWTLRLGSAPPPPHTVVWTFWHKKFEITKSISDKSKSGIFWIGLG